MKSKLQQLTAGMLNYTGFLYEENIRPAWLKSSLTGKRLEMDFYIEELQLAIEVQGQQHYQYVPHFHCTYEAFQRQVARDEEKKNILEKHKIRLFLIHCEDDLIALREILFSSQPILGRSLQTKKREKIKKRHKEKYDKARAIFDFLSTNDADTISRNAAFQEMLLCFREYQLTREEYWQREERFTRLAGD